MNRALVFIPIFIALVYARNPIVFTPGYSLTWLDVTVEGASVPGCPTNGQFRAGYTGDQVQGVFDVTCMTKLLELNYDETSKTWSNLPGVTVTIPERETGSRDCLTLPAYSGFFDYFESKGYDETNLLAACYDWRVTPKEDVIDGPSFLENTKKIIEKAYKDNNGKRVYLISHSNGPIMILYFLHNYVDAAWKDKYIEGFIPIAGNFGGQAFFPVAYFTGLSIFDFAFDSSTRETLQYWPENYYSFPIPKYFKNDNDVTILKLTNGTSYTVSQVSELYKLAGLDFADKMAKVYTGTVGPHTPPGVRTWGFYGKGTETMHGIELEDLWQTEEPSNLLFRDGDGNQEDIDNEAFLEWSKTMPKNCFSAEAIDGVDHFALPNDEGVLDKINAIVTKTREPISCVSSSLKLVAPIVLMCVMSMMNYLL